MDKINQLKSDIKTITIQGATNVALAVIEGMKIAIEEGYDKEQVINLGNELALLRENEPMARNAVRFVQYNLSIGLELDSAIDEYKAMIDNANIKIAQIGGELISKYNSVLTHCHSSTSTKVIIEAAKLNKEIKAISCETRPKYQGHKTSKELSDAGVDVTLVVDSMAASLLSGQYLAPEVVIIGNDEMYIDGTVVNKVGSYSIALLAKTFNKPFYIATSLLKVAFDRDINDINIEMRERSEVWQEANDNINILNPSFDKVPADLISGYITEAGILTKDQIKDKSSQIYNWITNT